MSLLSRCKSRWTSSPPTSKRLLAPKGSARAATRVDPSGAAESSRRLPGTPGDEVTRLFLIVTMDGRSWVSEADPATLRRAGAVLAAMPWPTSDERPYRPTWSLSSSAVVAWQPVEVLGSEAS